MIWKIIINVAYILAIAIVICLLAAWPFMWIWNHAVVAAVQFANPINYSVAFWLMMFISMFITAKNNKCSDS